MKRCESAPNSAEPSEIKWFNVEVLTVNNISTRDILYRFLAVNFETIYESFQKIVQMRSNVCSAKNDLSSQLGRVGSVA